MLTQGLQLLSKIFSFLPNAQILSILRFAKLKYLEQGELLLSKYDRVRNYVVVIKGRLKVIDRVNVKNQNVWPCKIERGQNLPFKWELTTTTKN